VAHRGGIPLGKEDVILQVHPASPGWARPIIIVSDVLDSITEAMYVVLTVTFAVVMLVGVFFRYVLNSSLAWSDELALIVFAWATLLAIATGYRHGKHVNIDIFVRALPSIWRTRVALLAEGLSGGYLLALFVSSIQALDVVSRTQTNALQWPGTVPFSAIPIASVLMLVHWVRRIVEFRPVAGPIKLGIALGFLAIVYLPVGQYLSLTGVTRFAILTLSLLVPLLIGMPVAFGLGLLATTYVSVIGRVPFHAGAMQVFYGIEVLTLVAIPLLILSGTFMHAAGIARQLVDFAQLVVGRFRGGLGASNVVASFLFGDISGSSVADTAAIGTLMIPEMKRRGYQSEFCAALQGAAGTLGMTAPLSISLLLYATAISVSTTRVAAATVLPSFLVAGSFMLIVLVTARRRGYPREHVPRQLVIPRILGAVPGMLALALIVAGILGGVVTPAEVGVILLAYVLLLSVFYYRTAQPRALYALTIQAGHISGMTLFMASTSVFVGFVLARDNVPSALAETISQVTTNRLAVLFIVNFVIVILGMVLEAPAIIFGFLPSVMPLLQTAGVDPIHFGVIFFVNMALGMLVPPVALNLFISSAIADVRYEHAVRAAVPFMIVLGIDMVLLAVFPHIALLLPHLLFGHPIR
jgi:C4-dicarboxylate transporter DctM subunit